MERFENQLEILINGQHSIIRTINHAMKKNKRHAERKTKEMKFIQQKNKPLSPNDVSKLVHLPEALQRNISKFTQNILFTSSNIQDDLISMHCLSEDECTDITSKANPKDQVRLLIRKIKSRGPESIDKFLKVIEEDKPELINDVYKTLDEIVNEYKDNPVCAICVLKNTVDLKDIVDSLWEEKVISDDIFQDIVESNSLHLSRPLIWNSIMAALNDHIDQVKAKDILINALQPKYDYIVGYINQNPDRPSLNCWCCTKCLRISTRRIRSEYGSQSDISRSLSRLPTFLYDEDDQEDSISSPQDLPSTDLLTYENPDRFCNIQGSEAVDITSKSSSSETVAESANQLKQLIPIDDVNDEVSVSRVEVSKENQELKCSSNKISKGSTLTFEIHNSAIRSKSNGSNKYHDIDIGVTGEIDDTTNQDSNECVAIQNKTAMMMFVKITVLIQIMALMIV